MYLCSLREAEGQSVLQDECTVCHTPQPGMSPELAIAKSQCIGFQCHVSDEGVTMNTLEDTPFVCTFCVYVYLCICAYVYLCICVFVYLRFCVFVYIHIWFQCRVPDEGVTRNALVDAPFVNFCICGYVFCVFVYLRLCVFVYLWFCVFVYMCIWFQCCVPNEDVTRSALGGFVPFPHFLLARSPEY